MNLTDTKTYFLSVIILTTCYINNSYQALSFHCTLSIWSWLLFTTTLLDRFSFPILQKGNWGSENFKCIVLATHKQTKNIYYFKSLYPWLGQTLCEICLQITLKVFVWRIIVSRIWYRKNQVRILISEGKIKQRELTWSQGSSQDGHKKILMRSILVLFSHVAVRVGPKSTPAFPTYKYCKPLFSTWLSSQLPSAFWEMKGPNEPVTILLRVKCTLLTPYMLVHCYVPTFLVWNINNVHDSIKEQPVKENIGLNAYH